MALKIIDLVDIQKLENEIIDIDDFDEESIVFDYVITDEIRGHLERILHKITSFERDIKNSSLIYGGYGTGKSHFLAFLYSILTRKELFEKINIGKFSFPNCFVIKLNLVGVLNKFSKLENLIFYTLEQEFKKKYNKEIVLQTEKEYLQIFTKNFIDSPQFKKYLKEQRVENWEELLEHNQEKAVQIARDYENESQIRVISEGKFRQKIDKFLDKITEEEKQEISLIILIDELADYLDKSVEWETIAQNISFLQEIGEESRKIKLHFIATLQEEKWFEEKGIDRDKWQKIRDRFESFTLSNIDFKKIAGERILRKRDPERLVTIYQEIKRKFPQILFDEKNDKQGFLQIYPVHPFVFKVIEKMNLAGGTTRQRTSLKFISDGVEKIKNNSYDTFLSIDSAFDYYFEDPEIQRRKLKNYYDVYLYFSDNVFPKIDKEFQGIATAIIKTLIVLKIGNFEEKTAQEICDLVLQSIGKDEINYEIYGGILEQLREKGGAKFLKCITKVGNPAYYIDIIHRPSAIEEIENKARGIRDDDSSLFNEHRIFWEEKIKEAKLGSFSEEPRGLLESSVLCCNVEGILWNSRNTERKGGIFFIQHLDEKILITLSDKFNSDVDLDFEIIITPKNYNLQSKITDDRLIIFEADNIPQVELVELKRALAVKEIEKIEERTDMLEELKIEKRKITEKVRKILQEAYFERGKIYNTKNINIQIKDFKERSIKDLIQTLIEKPLCEKYLEHPKFPKLYSRTHTNKLIKEFIRQGEVENPIRNLYELIEGILQPLEIVDRKTSAGSKISYTVKKNLQDTKYTKEILKRIKNAGDHISIQELRKQIRRHFGIEDHFFEILLYSLLKRGKIVLIKGDESYRTTNFDELTSEGPKKWDFFNHVSIPTETDNEKIARIIEGLVGKKVDLNDEEELEHGWNELCKLKGNFRKEDIINKVNLLPDELNKSALIEKLNQIDNLFSFFEKIQQRLPRKVELKDLDIPQLLDSRGILRKFEKLISDSEFLHNKIRYLLEIEVDKFEREKNKILDALKDTNSMLENLDKVKKQLENFIDNYASFYIEKHEQAVGANAEFIRLKELEKLQEYKNLKMLANIKALKTSIGYEEINNEINKILSKSCNNLREEQIKREPVCTCGYKIEEGFDIDECLNKIKKDIYTALKNIANKAKQDINKDKFEKLKEKEQNIIQDLLDKNFINIKLDDEKISLLEELFGKIKEFRKSLKDLFKILPLNEAIRKNELKIAFDKFLSEIPDEENIRIIIEEETKH